MPIFTCCWCHATVTTTTGGSTAGHIICHRCWNAGDDGYAPDCGETCREESA